MSDTTSQWTTSAEAVARDVLSRYAADVDRQARWPAESLEALKAGGFFGLTVPTTHGGAGAGPRTFADVLSKLAEGCASTAMIYLMHVCGTQVIVAATGFGRRDQLLRDIAAGRHLSTLAFSEKGSRSHFWAPVSQATADGDVYHITAEKSWVTSAGRANGYIVSTRSAGTTEPTTSTLYYVPEGTTGLSVAGSWAGLGLRGNASAPMRLKDVDVPASDRVSGEGGGFDTMINVILPWFQLGSAAVAVGIARASVAGVREHLLGAKFEHLGQTLAALPNLRAELALMQITTDAQAAFLHQVAWKMENPQPDTMLAVLGSKAAATEAALQVTDLAMRVCGGTAFSGQFGVERNFRDARAGSVMAPTTDVLYDFVGKAVLGMPLF
ncbi:acyl-CoA dehydrogenase family protein [Fimbriiglobus ruber]|uniref:Acyl-CoA dehydrogenase, short-chain specific n=1 Tax=Fimbriiglobus ruber TaxID=1908690 RepID=A0A225DDL1_9BACT|nr:acyl-CoA dehydrogenase family protein [Fimbriiglobus ruber]OWK39073.1 Acyl-CoA dehydrogenase, short-chain specific [Fimbriiglobus ruber]